MSINAWEQPNTLVIGHRGASAEAPENTMKAFKLAIEHGAHGLEFDVHVSADGVPVIIHDHTLDRTTNGSGPVVGKTASQLSDLDAGEGEGIPTLATLFETFGTDILYNLEIKDYRWRNNGTEQTISDLISSFGLQNYVLVSSFSPTVMRRAAAVLPPEVATAMIRFIGIQQYSYHLYSGNADHPYFRMVDKRYMQWAERRNYRVHAWTVDSAGEAKRLATLGVHGIITNRPREIVAAIS